MAPSEPQRVQELWFDDGNLVIQAENSQFRVFRGILAARSSVFQDMLSFPQPSDAELVVGCPLVRLPDSLWEVTVFLKAIFLPGFFRSFPAETDFDTVIGCLRLSHKYGVDYLRRRALIHLSSGHRSTLSDWDEIDHEAGEGDLSFKIPSWPWPMDSASRIYIVQLAREIDAPWLLPIAFYRVSVGFAMGTLGKEVFHGTPYNGVPASLSAQDQDSFVKGHNIQIQCTGDILRFLSHPPHIDCCTSSRQCLEDRLRVIDDFQEIVRDQLDVWEEDDWDRFEELCDTCRQTLRKTHTAARQAFWDKLPEIYDLPPWEELEEKRIAAIGTEWLR
ncbi:hypothetical protein C8R43DRAFT_700116 [Mycena crocata]|nr:hypothetical protein C8R43DRAFT_700116 [Mycena crocata]